MATAQREVVTVPDDVREDRHQVKREFNCSGCGKTFTSAKDFSDHFTRLEGSIVITGCDKV